LEGLKQKNVKETLNEIFKDEILLDGLIKAFRYLLYENFYYFCCPDPYVYHDIEDLMEVSFELVEKLIRCLEDKEINKCIKIIEESKNGPIFYPAAFEKDVKNNFLISGKYFEWELRFFILEIIDAFGKLKKIVNWLEQNLSDEKIKEKIIFHLQNFGTNFHFCSEDLKKAQKEIQNIMSKLLESLKKNDLETFKKNIINLVFYPVPGFNCESGVYDYFITLVNYLNFVIEKIKEGKEVRDSSKFLRQYLQEKLNKVRSFDITGLVKSIKRINEEIIRLLDTKKGEEVIKELAKAAYDYYLATKNIEALNVSTRLERYLLLKKMGEKINFFEMFNEGLVLVTKDGRILKCLKAKKYLLGLLRQCSKG